MKDEFDSAGAQVIAISSDPPEDIKEYSRKAGITISLLSDEDRRVISEYGVLADNGEIAVPSVFVIHQQGHITWRYIGKTIADRPGIEQVLDEVRK